MPGDNHQASLAVTDSEHPPGAGPVRRPHIDAEYGAIAEPVSLWGSAPDSPDLSDLLQGVGSQAWPVVMLYADLCTQPGGCAQGSAQGVLGAAGAPRCPGLGAEPPGEALLLGGCQHLALSFTADLADDVGVCVHVAVLSARAWPGCSGRLLDRLAGPGAGGQRPDYPFLAGVTGGGTTTHTVTPAASTRAGDAGPAGRCAGWLDEACLQGEAGEVGAAPGVRSCPGSGPGGSGRCGR